MNEIASDREKESSEDSESALQWEKIVRLDIACLFIIKIDFVTWQYYYTASTHKRDANRTKEEILHTNCNMTSLRRA